MRKPRNHLGRWLLASSVLIALIVSPFALAAGEGRSLLGGARNPGNDPSQSFTRETGIISNTPTYGTRQSNKSDSGGGAIYGCRSKAGGSPAGNEPCIRSVDLSDGLAFEMATGGQLAGTITASGGDNAKPFTTNATGVATGLNADRVDSKSADEISATGASSAVATVTSGVRFAAVSATGTVAAQRGVASVTRTGEGTYQVVFTDDASACAMQATETQFANAGAVGVELGADKKTVTVRTRSGGGPDGTEATPPTDRPFHLTATCL